jgi:hypothetical protein
MAVGQQPDPAALSGNEAEIWVDGNLAGFGKNLEVSIQNHVEPISAIGFRKPRALKSLNWSGTCSMEFTVLTTASEGMVKINTSSDNYDDYNKLYTIIIYKKGSEKKVVGTLLGVVNSESFSLSNNEFSTRKVEFELRNWEPGVAFN